MRLVVGQSAPPPAAGASAAEPDTTLSQPAPQDVPSPQAERISLTAGRATVAGTEADVVVVRFKDRIVYRSEADENRPSKVNCAADCVIVWPPLLADGSQIQLSGVDPKLVGTVTRADGFTQVTLDGWPSSDPTRQRCRRKQVRATCNLCRLHRQVRATNRVVEVRCRVLQGG
ncbi:hypothetical protein ACFPIJ_13335 [Dactylosporangium cerinum]|uniref:Lipoprotein n=1 Tax=Dactylosporangium cerinum TaxID=1434730 RepID=A0ABV9VW07_9ACTN